MNPILPISEEDKKKSYYKYYEEEMAPVDPVLHEQAAAAHLTPDLALLPDQVNRLLDPTPLPAEFGYCILPDGSAYMANRLFMPGVTPEMFDWWFTWHCLDSLRYKIWDPDDHLYAMTQNPEKARDASLSWRERLWGTRHDITEGFGAAPKDVVVPFVHPTEMGFDKDLYEAFPGTVIAMASHDVRTVSCHVVRAVEGGVELRTRFWFGWRLIDGKVVRGDDITYPEPLPKSLLLHNIKEFTNLARLLPRIFPEERDNF